MVKDALVISNAPLYETHLNEKRCKINIDIDKLSNVQISNTETNSFRYRIVIKMYDYSCVTNFVKMGGTTILFVKECKTSNKIIIFFKT